MSHCGNTTPSFFKRASPLVRMPVNSPWRGQDRGARLYCGGCKPLQPWLPYSGGFHNPGMEPKYTFLKFHMSGVLLQ